MKLINPEELKLAIRDDDEIDGRNFAIFKMHIDEAEVVDANPVVHGRWILKETCGKHTEKFHCSVCNKIPKSLCTETYCPNCGAIMDGDVNG